MGYAKELPGLLDHMEILATRIVRALAKLRLAHEIQRRSQNQYFRVTDVSFGGGVLDPERENFAPLQEVHGLIRTINDHLFGNPATAPTVVGQLATVL